MSESEGDKETRLQKREDEDDVRRRLWKKFKPKLWLSSMWKKVSDGWRLNNLEAFLRKNVVSVSLSLGLGFCYLLSKLGKSRCNVVPYSNLLAGIQNGSVTRVQFEENSRHILYNTKTQGAEKAQIAQDNPLVRKNGFTWDTDNGAILKIQELFANVMRNFSKNQRLVLGSNSTTNVDEDKRQLLKNQVTASGWQYSTRYVDDDYRQLLDLMKEKGTTFGLRSEPFYISLGRRIFNTALNQAPSWAMLLLISRGLGGGSSIARKPSKQHMVTFDDIEGVDDAKAEVMEIVSCLQGDVNYEKLGAKLPRGVLLVGPPGTGKTLLARAVAEKAGVPFFITCASEFVELFVGRGASRIRDLFKQARKAAPSIIFIDELDAVGLRRGRGFNTEGDQTLNQLLTELDGFESDKKVVVFAATNRAEMLDPALLRPGRFSRKVFVREPDEDGRMKILAVHFRGIPLEDDRNLICSLVASCTEGMVGADLANIANEAALLAGRRGGKCVSQEDIMEAVGRAKLEISDREPIPDYYEQEGREIFPVEFISRVKDLTQDRM